MSEVNTSILYVRGLNTQQDPKEFEVRELAALQEAGITTAYADINWPTDTAEEIVDTVERQAIELARSGDVVIAGHSAGGVVAMTVFERLADNPRFSAVSIAGRLAVGNYSKWSPRYLRHATHLNWFDPKPAYRNAYDLIWSFEHEVLPRLTVMQPTCDLVVPRKTMTPPDIQVVTLSARSHDEACVEGLRLIGELLTTKKAT